MRKSSYKITTIINKSDHMRGVKLMKIGFIGCGNMGSAMISGMLKKGLYKIGRAHV